MGSVLSSMPDRNRKTKKKKRRKKKYPRKKSLTSSSSSSFSSPSKSRRTRHQKLRHHSDTDSSSSSDVPRRNVKNLASSYEQLQKRVKNSPAQEKRKSPNRPKQKFYKQSPSKSRDDLNVNEFEEYVRNRQKDKRSLNDKQVTIELDIPDFTARSYNKGAPRSHNNTATVVSIGKMNVAKIEKECIEAHNEYRKCHGADPLARAQSLSTAAQKWADHLAKTGKLQHSSNKLMGENVAYSSKSSMTGHEICKMWYDEIKDYNFRRPGFAGNTGHFTQVVWKGSTQIGVGVASGPKGTFAVANYSPAGNITNTGLFEKNVKSATGTPKLPTTKDKKEKEGKGRQAARKKSRSSSASSSSDDERNPGKAKPGTTVKTTTEEYVEDGQRKKKTITVTTTVTVTPEGTKTSTKTNTKIETLGGEGKSGGGSAYDKLKNLSIDDSSSSDDDDDDLSRSEKRKIREECLSRHNELRKRHSAPNLKKSRRMQRAAQKHANKMLRQGKLFHSPSPKYGENVAMKMPTPTGAQICDMWYDEKKDYSFDKAVFSGNTGHFTQVVWEGSTDIGIGVASKDGRTYVAAYYDPPGNVSGHFAKNVHRR